MNIEQLTALGGVISAAAVPEEITWIREDESGGLLTDSFLIHVKQLAYGDIEQFRNAQANKKDLSRSYAAHLISLGVRLGENGEEQLTYEQAYQLHPTLAGAMLAKVITHNPALRRKKKAPEGGGSDLARTGAARNRRTNNRRGKAKPVRK